MSSSSAFSLQAVLFDLDGTLLDTAPDFAHVLNHMRQRHGLEALPYEPIRNTVSNGARALVTLGFELEEQDAGFNALREELLELYSAHLSVKTAPFPGIDGLLQWIEQQQLPWGVVTNKPRRYAEPILADLNLQARCGVLVCPDDVTHTKPDPEPMHLACKTLQVEPAHTVYLGDHRRDIEAGYNAGMKTLAVNYGYIDPSDPAQQWNADFYVDHADDIASILQTLR